MAAPGKVKRSNDLPQGVERLKEEHKKVRSNVYFENQTTNAFLQILKIHARDLSSAPIYLLYVYGVFAI